MSFDGMVTSAVARSLQKILQGGKIEKIYQPETDEIILYIHNGREKHMLYISAASSHARIHLVTTKEANPQNPMGFCMLLRKHIQGGRIADIVQKDSERIVEISVETVNELGFCVNKKLIVEIMGKHSNIVLIDVATERIIDSIKRISIDVNRYRQLLPGQHYIYPPTQGKRSYFQLSFEDMLNIMKESNGTPAKILLNHIQGISPGISEEIVTLSEKANPALPHETNYDGHSYYSILCGMIERIQENTVTPLVYLDREKHPIDFHIFPISTWEGSCERLNFQDINEAVSYFYSHKSSSNRIKQKASDLIRTLSTSLDKLYLKKQRLSEDLLKAENAEVFRLYGELITANLHAIKESKDTVALFNYYENETISIPLDKRFSPSQNAQRYYKKYAKSKTAITEKNIQLEETNKDICYLESIITYGDNATSIEEIEELREELVENGYLRRRKNPQKAKKAKPSPHSYLTSDGFRILVGRNNKENDMLTFKTADKRDVWFHTKDIPGSHVILFTEGKEPTENAILEAASLAAFYSKGRTSENVPVDYTKVRHVKKPSGAKPGMVIFVDNNTVYVDPGVPKSSFPIGEGSQTDRKNSN